MRKSGKKRMLCKAGKIKRYDKVSVVRCTSYKQKEVDKAVEKALQLIGYKFGKGKTVLIKPNLIGPFSRNQAATTHPSIIAAVCKILKRSKAKIIIGESSYLDTKKSFRTSGAEDVAKKYSAKIMNFDTARTIKVKGTGLVGKFYMPKILKDADIIIDMPKLKTHALTKYTGAIKNLFGTVIGARKRYYHKQFPNEKKFCRMLVDLYMTVKPELTIMDAVYGMEGNGPTAGSKKKTGFIIASRNAAAVDVVASEMIGFRKSEIFTNYFARQRGLINNIQILPEKPKPVEYKKPTMKRSAGLFMLLESMFGSAKIVVDKVKCIRCGRCESNCPAGAITMNPYPVIDKQRCIHCLCCAEICPKHAIRLKENILIRALNWFRDLNFKPDTK